MNILKKVMSNVGEKIGSSKIVKNPVFLVIGLIVLVAIIVLIYFIFLKYSPIMNFKYGGYAISGKEVTENLLGSSGDEENGANKNIELTKIEEQGTIFKKLNSFFVGDKNQLESVGPGDVFRELILSGVIPVTVLDQCFRQENQTILENARKINFGKTNLVYNDCFCFVPAQNQEVAGQKIEKLFCSEWKGRKKSANAVQVLTARKEDAEILNQKIRDRINPAAPGKREIKNGGRTFRIQDKVMQTKNIDEISNGDIGVVDRIWQKDGIWQMDVDFGDERIKSYAENEHWNLELAYAITVYKGQGSEYEIVIIPVLSCYWRALRRNLYYTAVTRAKRKVILVGSKQALAQAIRTGKGKGRNTILGARLRKVYRYLESEEKIA